MVPSGTKYPGIVSPQVLLPCTEGLKQEVGFPALLQ